MGITIKRTGEELRDEAMARVEAHADPDWKHMAVRAFMKVAYGSDEFTTDDVWRQLEEWEVPAPHEPRAMGPIVRSLVTQGVIEPVGRRKKSALPQGHCRPVEVYRRVID